jgi:crossover junction endodeoxyribonuclease RusA
VKVNRFGLTGVPIMSACLTSSRPWAARQQGATRLQTPSLAVTLRFVPPDRRARDIDNLVASMKSGLDGLADALGVDDYRWEMGPPHVSTDVDRETGGAVRVMVSRLD